MSRKNIPQDTQTTVLLACARRCVLCYGLNGDLDEKKGQIAHIDQDNSNAKESNLVFLCFNHHDGYDSKTSQSKNISAPELIEYKKRLIDAIKNGAHHKVSNTNGTYNTSSTNQSGGVTAGRVDSLNVNISNQGDSARQIAADQQFALLYQTELSHFLFKFRMCLRWTLPPIPTDSDIDVVFHYAGKDLSQPFEPETVSKHLVSKIFVTYDFTSPMVNWDREGKPTGFNNILGILQYLIAQLDKALTKYGSSTSPELASRVEYMQKLSQSTDLSIRMDLRHQGHLYHQTADQIGNLVELMCKDFLLAKTITKYVSGGFPIMAGKVLKSHETEGTISVPTQFSNY